MHFHGNIDSNGNLGTFCPTTFVNYWSQQNIRQCDVVVSLTECSTIFIGFVAPSRKSDRIYDTIPSDNCFENDQRAVASYSQIKVGGSCSLKVLLSTSLLTLRVDFGACCLILLVFISRTWLFCTISNMRGGTFFDRPFQNRVRV